MLTISTVIDGVTCSKVLRKRKLKLSEFPEILEFDMMNSSTNQ